jgi:mono/diheme cytochrome c family protein
VLDHADRGDRVERLARDLAVVHDADVDPITQAGGGAMPAFGGKLTDQQIQQIADYVSQNAGQS